MKSDQTFVYVRFSAFRNADPQVRIAHLSGRMPDWKWPTDESFARLIRVVNDMPGLITVTDDGWEFYRNKKGVI